MKQFVQLWHWIISVINVLFYGVYFPNFNYYSAILNITDTHIYTNGGRVFRLSFASMHKRLPPHIQSSVSIYVKQNSDQHLVDVHCVDTTQGNSNSHFVGTMKKGVDFDLNIDIDTGNYYLAYVTVNVSPRSHYAPHTVKLIMPMMGNRLGLIWKA